MFFFAKDIILNVLGSTLDSIDVLSKYDNKYLNGNKYEASTAKSLFGSALYLFPVIINLIYLRKCRDEKMIKSIRGRVAQIGLIVLFMAITLREYDSFFHALNWRDAYMHFQTIFSA